MLLFSLSISCSSLDYLSPPSNIPMCVVESCGLPFHGYFSRLVRSGTVEHRYEA